MKKYAIFSLLIIPMTVFAAPSVRVLGAKSSGTVSATPATPMKAQSANVSGKEDDNNTSVSRVSAPIVKSKPVTVTTKPTVVSESRFPSINPGHVYSSVTKPKQTGGTSSVVTTNVDKDEIINTVTQNVEENYYNKQEVYTTNEFKEAVQGVDDPRFDMVQFRDGSPREKWTDHELYQQRLDEGYLFMWVEEE